MQSGELTVTGHDHVTIHLEGRPDKVVVHFTDHITPNPCNPHHHDMLEYDVHHVHHGYTLKIRWKVTGVREITWKVYY